MEDLLAERGLDISYEPVRRWIWEFGECPALAKINRLAACGLERKARDIKRCVRLAVAEDRQAFLARSFRLSLGGAPDLTHLSHAEKDALILTPFRQLTAAEARIAALYQPALIKTY